MGGKEVVLMESSRLFEIGAMGLNVERCRVGCEDMCLIALVLNGRRARCIGE
jgi:hypothetical protein